jgi:hypothetical protein
MEVSGQLHAPAALPPGNRAPGGWTSGSFLDDVDKRKFLDLLGLDLWPLVRPACSQLLYRLRYPGSLNISTP